MGTSALGAEAWRGAGDTEAEMAIGPPELNAGLGHLPELGGRFSTNSGLTTSDGSGNAATDGVVTEGKGAAVSGSAVAARRGWGGRLQEALWSE